MGFHSQDNLKYGDASIDKALAAGQITPDDADLIRAYAAEYQATRHVSNLRVLKSIFELVNWRRFIRTLYREVTITEIHAALNLLNTVNNLRGKPFKQNTKHDYVKGLKCFLHWMIEEGHSKLSKDKVDKIKVPAVDTCTTSPDAILQEDDILAMVSQARTFRDKALLFVLYESGCRIGELARIKWKDVVFNDDSTVGLTITDTKTRKIRHALLGASVEYLANWRNNYPGTRTLTTSFLSPPTVSQWNTAHSPRSSAGPQRRQVSKNGLPRISSGRAGSPASSNRITRRA